MRTRDEWWVGVNEIAAAECRLDESSTQHLRVFELRGRRFYYWSDIKTKDILTGKFHIPPSVRPLHLALRDAETGIAQGDKMEHNVYDVVKVPPNEVLKRLSRGDGSSRPNDIRQSRANSAGEGQASTDDAAEDAHGGDAEG